MLLKNIKSLIISFVVIIAAAALTFATGAVFAHKPVSTRAEEYTSQVLFWELNGSELVIAGNFTDFADGGGNSIEFKDTAFDGNKGGDDKSHWHAADKKDTIEKVTFISGYPTSMYRWFAGLSNLTTVCFEGSFSSYKCEDLSGMFFGCKSLRRLDLSRLDFSAVKKLEGVFRNCSALTEITWGVSKPTSNATAFSGMFNNCAALETVDLSGFDMSGANNPSKTLYLFQDCPNIKTIVAPQALPNGYNIYLEEETFWNGDDDVTTITSVSLGKTLKRHNGHDYKDVAAKAATCTEDGVIAHKECTVCEKNFDANNEQITSSVVIPKLGHSYGEWKVTKPATCTEKGEETRVCSHNSAHTETREVSALGHTVVTDTAKAATCTETGLTEGSHCSVCNAVLVAQQIIKAKGHTVGTAATCTAKAVCATCGREYGEPLGHDLQSHAAKAPTCTDIGWDRYAACSRCDYNTKVVLAALGHDIDGLAVLNGKDKYTAFDEYVLTGAEVYTHCSREHCDCEGGRVKKIDNSIVSVTYATNDSFLHCADKAVALKATVDGKELSVDSGVEVGKREAEVVWEYTVSPVSEENEWVWLPVTDGAHFTYDGAEKNYRVRARFTGAVNDPDKDKYFYRATDDALLVDGTRKGIASAATYTLRLDIDKFAEYSFIDNAASIKVEPYKISLDDADVYRWTLGAEQGSTLRDGYVKQENGAWLYYANEVIGGERVARSIVRYRGDDTDLSIMLNGGEIADLFAGSGKRTSIVYSGATKVGAIGKYTAIATLTLNDAVNYKYTGEIAVANERGMTVEITDGGAKAVITKEWYVATIDNGLLNITGGEYKIGDWTFGRDITIVAPKLEHGDDGFDVGNISESDRRIAFELFTDANGTNRIGEKFYRYNFGEYINSSVPSGTYFLTASATGVADGEGILYQDFTRTFTFEVAKGELEIADSLVGKTFEHTYNGNVQLFDGKGPTVTAPKYLLAADRIGIWKGAEFDKYYGAAYMTYHLQRWHTTGGAEHEYVTVTQLNNTLGKKQAPREADTYTVYYRINALNYNTYGSDNDKTFTVVIAKRNVEVPTVAPVTYDGAAHGFSAANDAPYNVTGAASFVDANADGYDVTLTLKDADNYCWKGFDGVTVTVKLVIEKAEYDMSGVAFGGLDVLYDGTEHLVAVTGLPDGVTYTPVGATAIGRHELTVRFASANANYKPINSRSVTLVIRAPQLVKPDEDGGGNKVVVTIPTGFAPEVELVVTEVAKENYGAYDAVAQAAGGEIGFVYDVTLKSGGVAVQPDGMLTVKLLIPAELRDKNFKLFRLHGSDATETEYAVDGDHAVVSTDKLSEFIFVGEKAETAPNALDTLWLALSIVMAIVIAAEIAYLVYRHMRKKKTSADK